MVVLSALSVHVADSVASELNSVDHQSSLELELELELEVEVEVKRCRFLVELPE